MIELRAVSKEYGAIRALRDVNASIEAGELVLLLGGNGAGKSTLVRSILGIVPYRGEIRVAGFDPLRQGPQVRRRIGYMAQSGGLRDDLTVGETLDFYGALRGVDPLRGGELLASLGLGHAGKARVGELSGGQLQRLGFAVALLSCPEILLLDEPTASLDAASRADVARRLRRLADRGTTVVVSTHAEDELRRVADRALTLDAGRLVADRPVNPRDTSRSPSAPRSGGVDDLPGRERRGSAAAPPSPAGVAGDSRHAAPPLAQITGQVVRDAVRDRWIIVYTLLLAILGTVAAVLGSRSSAGLGLQMFGRTTATLTNLCLMVAPLVGLSLGAAAIAGERERGTLEMLLAQPLRRRDLVVGKYLGLVLSLAGATVLGFAPTGLFLAGHAGAASLFGYLLFPLLCILLICAMTGIGLLLSVCSSTGSQAQSRAVFVWFAFVLLYDLLLMGALVAAGLGGKALAALLVVNPVDAARVLAVLGFEADLHALGPAGALLVGRLGVLGTAATLLLTQAIWTAVPLGIAVRVFNVRPQRARRAITAGTADMAVGATAEPLSREQPSSDRQSVDSNVCVKGVEAS